jgi:hypothetical protein
MMRLQDNPRFKDDYSNLQKEISKIDNEYHKKELTFLLQELSREILSIDMHHDAMLVVGKMPDNIRETREKILSLRKKIDVKLKQYKRV